MRRRTFLETAAATGVAATAAAQSGKERPNILLIHCHDLGQHLNCYGVKTVRSPNIDALATEGVLFEKNFCTAPQCSPSRASIFTGRYPHANSVMGLCHAGFAWDLDPRERHLGQLLHDAGYATAGVGVIHETHSGPERCGLESYVKGSRAADVADGAVAEIRRLAKEKDRPFYLQAGCFEPHRIRRRSAPMADLGFIDEQMEADSALGVTVPPYLKDTPSAREELAELQGAVRHMDSHVGRILEALRESGLTENTLTIFTTDHGVALPRAKCAVYEPGLETAFILRLPSRPGWQGGQRLRQLVSNVDLLPTVLDAAGVAIPSVVQGRSVAPLLDGRDYQPRDAVFGELTYHGYYDPRRTVRTETHKLIVNFASAPGFMDSSQSWRPRCETVVPENPALSHHPDVELYDLRSDPWEQRNLAQEESAAGVMDELRQRLLRHLEETGDPLLAGPPPCPMYHRAMGWLRNT